MEEKDIGDSFMKKNAFLLIVLCLLVLAVAHYFVSVSLRDRSIYTPMEEIRACQNNMSKLHISLKDYSNNHNGILPSGQDWCDILLKETNVSKAVFICENSHAEIGQSSYALNKAVLGLNLSELPRDTVLLFETVPAWNQVGGADMVTTENHSVLSAGYFNVVLARGRLEHCHINEINGLRWEP